MHRAEIQDHIQKTRGRGALTNKTGRFERFQRVVEQTDDATRAVRIEVREEQAKSIISKNTSPDIIF